MANKKTIAEWLIENIDSYHIKFTELMWTRNYEFPFFDFSCEIRIDGIDYGGRGTSFDRDEAIVKSFVEATERLNLRQAAIRSSNGVAAHSLFEVAKDNSACELIERDSFLCHYLTLTPFGFLDHNLPQNVKSWCAKFEQLGVDFIFRKLVTPKGLNGIIACAFGTYVSNPFGLIVATACDSIHDRAVVKAFFEISRAIADKLETGMPEAISIEEFFSLNKKRISDHYRLSMGLDYAKDFKERFLVYGAPENLRPLDVSNIQFNVVADHQELLKDLPVVTVRALSGMAQQMFWGTPDPQLINLERLSQFTGAALSFADINKVPHPFR